MKINISTATEQGLPPREVNEDAVKVGKMFFAPKHGVVKTLWLADGFGKEEETAEKFSQMIVYVASQWLQIFLERGASPEQAMRETYALIDRRTTQNVVGSTLSGACIMLEEGIVAVAVLGDSPVIVDAPSSGLLGGILPREHRGLSGSDLWGCFGDVKNRAYHTQEPEVQVFAWRPSVLLGMFSDGVITSPEEQTRERKRARTESELLHYRKMLARGARAEDIVRFARRHGSTDDTTAIVVRAR